ncbi:RAD2 [Candida margitis]|uniref:RAD2 n=1 Tax=Candida margitis TaxID=1775924 RepID=UPI0022277F92|nr:RAD2 [Candida margitis]KAI5970561.1 RAD2 [Candida margitis]
MGVQSLWDIVGPSARPVRLEALSRKKLAVDASIWIYQFLKAVRDKEGNALPQSHIVGFFRRICKLLYFGIQPIFVFDGGVPVLKRQTINERKNRRQQNSESTRETAQKLLAIQLQRQAEESVNKQKGARLLNREIVNDDDDVIYFDDLPMNKVVVEEKLPERPKSIKFRKTDEYHLPDLNEFRVSRRDQRIMPDDDNTEVWDDFDHVDGININEVDPKSKEFANIPIATQYMILNHLRLKSRLRMGYRKEQLQELFPNSMDFSKFQIQQVQKRNFYTQKLMNVTGMNDEDTIDRRVAGEKDRKYALVKNEDGWTLALEGGGSTAENPINLEVDEWPLREQPNHQDTAKSDETDSDFEDVILEDTRETQEERMTQEALIKSIYEKYENQNPSHAKESTKQLSSYEQQLRKAVEESKQEYFKLRKEEASKENDIRKGNSLDLQSSVLFADATDTAERVSNRMQKPPHDHKGSPSNNDLQSSLLFDSQNHKTGRINLKVADNEDFSGKGQTETEEDFGADARSAESLDTEASMEKDNNETQSVQKSPQSDERDYYDEKTRNQSKDTNSSTSGQQTLPDWFQNEINKTLNPHNEKFVPSSGLEMKGNNIDDEAGLIPWFEAKELFEMNDENELTTNDDVIELPSRTIDGLSDENNDQREDTNEAMVWESETRRPAVIDYDFEEGDEEILVQQLQREEVDHENLKSQIKSSHDTPISSIETRITEEQLLQEKLQKAKRDSDEVTESMINDVQELLKRFGIPYITAPMEAEAQCAELLRIGLVDGIITDDSDCFLFGGDRIYKNMFNQKQFVECYIKEDIETNVGLSRENLIELAMLLGSDYTQGIKGIGPVLAVEILAEFGSLKRLKSWFDERTKTTKLDQTSLTPLQKSLTTRIKNGKLFLPDNFPNKVVFDAYTHPEVDSDKSEFKWGIPNLDQIRSFLMYNVNWSQERVDEVMVPLVRDLNKKRAEESAKDLSIEAAMSASARIYDTPGVSRPQEISSLLNSRSNRDISNGMKCVIALIAKGEDGLPYFADVVKNVTNENAKVKQMVFIYLTKYADVEADTALLSINSIQKTLNEKSPSNRANAIRSLAGIKISSIVPILALSLKRTSSDPSPQVRAATAIAIGKVYEISGKSKRQMLDILGNLLADSDAVVVSAAIKSHFKVQLKIRSEAKKWEHIHGNFRRLCSLLLKFDEFAQVYAIDMLTLYCRKFITKPLENEFDPDLELLVRSVEPLAQSISDIVVISVARCIYLLAPSCLGTLDVILTRISSSANDTQTRVYSLQTIECICQQSKHLFTKKFRSFYILPDDAPDIAILKLGILSLISDDANFKYIFEELKFYALSSRRKIVAKESIRAMAKCSQISSTWNEEILQWCLANIGVMTGETLNEILTVIRFVIQQKCDATGAEEKSEIMKVLNKLAYYLNKVDLNLENDAKASIIWTVGEYTVLAENAIGPDLLRVALKSFARQAENVRYQLLVLACKIVAFEMGRLTSEHGDSDQDKVAINAKLQATTEFKMFEYALQLARYDPSYDTRDRVRMFSVLLDSGVDRAQLASLIFQVPKSTPLISEGSIANDEEFKAVRSYFKVTEWATDLSQIPPSSIRKEAPVQYNKLTNASSVFSEGSKSPSPVNQQSFSSKQVNNSGVSRPEQSTKAYQLQSLDDFFGNDEESSEEEGSEEEDSEEEESEEEESEEEESEEEDSEEEESEEEESEGQTEDNEEAKHLVSQD